MSGIQIIALTGVSGIIVVALLIAAYLNGHHNGKHEAQIAPNPPPKPPQNPANSTFILDSIEDGVVEVDAQGIVRTFNLAAGRVTGWQPSEAIGLDFQSALPLLDEHGKAYAPQSHPFSKALSSKQPIHDSKALLSTRSNRQVPVSVIVSPMPGGGAVGVFRDITREKAEEEERTEFISTASHEMRTPIASIEGYLSLALNSKAGKIDADTRSYLEKAHAATQHLGQLFQDLLTTTRAEDSRLAGHAETVEVGSIIAQAVEEASPAAAKKGLSLHYLSSREASLKGKVVKPLFYVKIDAAQLKEVVQNLLDNAIKYTAAGSVSLKLTGDNSVVQIQVTDTGSGIPSEDISHLFQKFYRVDSYMTRGVGGTGLGLFICRKILELYDGRIWVESRLGKGSTFFVNLPRISADKALSGKPVNSVLKSDQR